MELSDTQERVPPLFHMCAAADDVVLDGRIEPREIGGEAADADD